MPTVGIFRSPIRNSWPSSSRTVPLATRATRATSSANAHRGPSRDSSRTGTLRQMLSGPKAACACPTATAFCAKSGNGSTQSRPCGELLIFDTRTAFPESFSAFANSPSFVSSSVSESKMSRPSAFGCSALAALTTRASKERFHGHRPYRSRLASSISISATWGEVPWFPRRRKYMSPARRLSSSTG